MSSTEYTLGHFGKKSSRVLKPPGGGSSDIFGLGNPPSAAPQEEPTQTDNSNTKNRLFGSASYQSPASTPQKTSSNVFVNQTPSSVSKNKYVRRNPITGEGIDYPDEKSGSSEKENEEKIEAKDSEKEVEPEVPAQVIQTSIRIRNPPGGKSSGIF